MSENEARDTVLASLGVSLDWHAPDPAWAEHHEAAKDAIFQAHAEIEQGQPGLAIHTLDTELGEAEQPRTLDIGAAAFFLRGRAHEAQGRDYHARIDYELALKLQPAHQLAHEALQRLNRPAKR